jgi:transposase
VLCNLVPGGIRKEISAGQAARILEQVRPSDAVVKARCELAAEFLTNIRRLDAQLRDTNKKLAAAVRASGTSLTGLFGIGPVIAGTVIGDVRQVFRFPDRDHCRVAPVHCCTGAPQRVHRPSCLDSRAVVWGSSGSFTFWRRSAQYLARAGSSGDAPPLTRVCRTIPVQDGFGR